MNLVWKLIPTVIPFYLFSWDEKAFDAIRIPDTELNMVFISKSSSRIKLIPLYENATSRIEIFKIITNSHNVKILNLQTCFDSYMSISPILNIVYQVNQGNIASQLLHQVQQDLYISFYLVDLTQNPMPDQNCSPKNRIPFQASHEHSHLASLRSFLKQYHSELILHNRENQLPNLALMNT
ncbi:hypothetical protein [Pedobacter psychroterrae]|uniref:hypothetical protein n=1 Tax=Pedobacter psychroterrae TaxID=2530453 RepID=UPI0013F15D46|nr:hypothetical protein [Pedobacter psychroterrae]